MKQISVLLLLAANFISLFPAQMERPKPSSAKAMADRQVETKPSAKPTIFPANPYATTTPQHHQHSHSTQLVCLPDLPSVDNIMPSSSYGVQQTRTTSTSAHLTPVYKHTNQTADPEEKKSLLRTNSLKPDENVMETLRRKAFRIISNEYILSRHAGQKYQSKKLVSLINRMNQARYNGIHEDIMGKYAYNKKSQCHYVHEGITYDIIKLGSLFFSLLKTYNLTVRETGEQLPFHLHTKKVYLKDIFSVPSDTNKISSDVTNIYEDFVTYPAFFQLLHAIQYAAQELPLDSVNIFTEYLYSNQNLLLQNYSQGSYANSNLKNEFYTNAYNLLLDNGTTHDLYHLMQMIDRAKSMKDIKNEDDLANGILRFDPNHPWTAMAFSILDENHSVENVKKRIALFCVLAKEYNNARLNKTTPTAAQCYAYAVKKSLNIAVQDNSLFDENRFAFASFDQLIKGTELLQEANTDKIDTYFTQCYPQHK
jgi:hypothetical protein